MVNVPLVVSLPLLTPVSSLTEPVLVPPITGTSLVPLMVTVTTLALPSALSTVKLSVRVVFGPVLLSAWTAALLLSSV